MQYNRSVIMTNSSFIGLLSVVLLSVADGFGVQPTFLQQITTIPSNTITPTKTSLFATATATAANNKYFQFEEMEDNESCTTEIYLNDDGSVDVSMTETDGPLPKATFGTWKVLEEGGEDDDSPPPFEMLIGRTFGTGIGMGEDAGSFTVERTFRGYVTMVGDAVAISGSMHILDDVKGDIDVGYFSMIDTTDAKDYTDEK